MEKISEEYIRREKVEKLKSTGLQEIKKEKLIICNALDVDLYKKEKEDYEFLIFQYYCLCMLETYLKDENSLWEDCGFYPEYDTVYYVVDLATIDIWLSKGVVRKYLSYTRDLFGDCFVLTDNFFGYRSKFVSVFESALYKQKKNGE